MFNFAHDLTDLAIRIIDLFGDLVHSVDEQGRTPLHILAAKPSAFKSGSNHGWFGNIIYNCKLKLLIILFMHACNNVSFLIWPN